MKSMKIYEVKRLSNSTTDRKTDAGSVIPFIKDFQEAGGSMHFFMIFFVE